jgi:hypothetical protein
MTQRHKPGPLYFDGPNYRQTYGSYKMTAYTVYESLYLSPLDLQIVECDRPGNYDTPHAAARVKARLMRMREAGVACTISAGGTARVELEWQHYIPNTPDPEGGRQYCGAHFAMSTDFYGLQRDYRLFQRLRRAMVRVQKYDALSSPLVLVEALDRLKARAVQRYVDPIDDSIHWVFYAPGREPKSAPISVRVAS